MRVLNGGNIEYEGICKEFRVDHPDNLQKLLDQMGANSEEVASTLRAAGVQGVRNTVRVLNPIVRYVQNMLRRDNLDADVMTGNTIRIHGAGGQEVVLPKAIVDFLDAFNQGTYPDLELSRQ
ncbi:MAG TPA: hypothetical protein VHC22_19260 [Pirellulales bacterium]|nr:hypothetical protein [Pirellulales bacterium]